MSMPRRYRRAGLDRHRRTVLAGSRRPRAADSPSTTGMRHPVRVAAAPGIVLLGLWIALSAWKSVSLWRKKQARERQQAA